MKHLKYSTLLLTLFALLAAGCGDSTDDNKAGPSRTCGAGTELNQLLECVPDGSVVCAEGTLEVNGRCIASESVCGESTVWEDGKCVPVYAEVLCGEGTTFAESTGRCMPDVVCGEGTAAVGGQCLSADEMLAVDADAQESAGENDPALGGIPQALAMPAAGDSFLLLGTIGAPADKNGDGTLLQDVDAYRFEAEGSDFVRVHLHQLGAGSFGFEVRGPNGYYREGPRNMAAPSRSLLLPAGGTYEIHVQPQATMFESDAGPVGGEDHRYLLVLENIGGLDLESATVVDTSTSQTFEASFQSPEKQLARLLSPAETAIRLDVEQGNSASRAKPVLMVLDAQGQVVQEFSSDQSQHLMRAAEENSRFLYVDYVQAGSLHEPVLVHTRRLETTSFPTVFHAGESGNMHVSGQLLPVSERYFALEVVLSTPTGTAVPQGVVVNFGLTRTVNRPAELTVFSPGSQMIASSLENRIQFYAEKAGVYLVEFKNLDALNSLSYSDLRVTTHVPVNLGRLNTSARNKQTASFSVPAGGVQYFTFEATEALVSRVSITAAIGQAPSWMELAGTDMRVLASADEEALTIGRHVILSPQRRVGTLFNAGAEVARGLVDVEAFAAAAAEVEPNDFRVQANEIQTETDEKLAPVHGSVSGVDVDFFKITLAKRALVEFETKIISGPSALKVQLLDEVGMLVEQADWRGDGIKVGAVLQKDTVYYLSVATDAPGETSEYAVFSSLLPTDVMLEAEPNNQSSRATLLHTDSLEMIGTLGGYTDADWFVFSLTQERWVRPVWRANAGFAATHDLMELTFFAADGTTVLDFETAVRLPAGKSFVRVSSPRSLMQGNTYHLGLENVGFEPLGVLTQGATLGRKDVAFTEDKQLVGYTFMLNESLPVDASQAVFVWSSEQVTVFDASGNAVFVAQDSGQVFGSAADPSMYAQSLAAGKYYVTIQRDFVSHFDVLIGQITHRAELEVPGENTNNERGSAEFLGELLEEEALTVFASVSEDDIMDYFEFVVPGAIGDAARSVRIEQFQVGEAVADINLTLQSATGESLADAHATPQVITIDLVPGRYFVRTWFIHDATQGNNRGQYLLNLAFQ